MATVTRIRAIRTALRHPLVVIAVALVCLSGWCMAIPNLATATHTPGADSHGDHHQTERGFAAHGAGAQGHDDHCQEATCCGVAAKESPRDPGPVLLSASLRLPAEVDPRDSAFSPTGRARDDGGPPAGFVAPLTC